MPFTNIDKSTAHFNNKLYTGNGGTQSITGVGFQPDMTWLKIRTQAYSHRIYDVCRGVTKYVHPDTNEAEYTTATSLTSFDTDGFSLGSNNGDNKSGDTFASWNWKAGGSGSSNTDGTINTTSTSVNTTAGFSISTYTGTGSNASFGHGLGVKPAMFMIKRLNAVEDWAVYHKVMTASHYMNLNQTIAKDTNNRWNGEPDTSVINLQNHDAVNGNGSTYVCYAFAEKVGFSKFGEYVGNSSTNGAFIQTNFAVKFLMVKEYNATGNWLMWDSTNRNWNRTYKMANSNDAENSADNVSIDLLSNGFKFRGTAGDSNGSGNILYMAFGQSIVGSNNTPALAR